MPGVPDVRPSGYVSILSLLLQGVVGVLSGGRFEVHLSIDTGKESSEVQVLRLINTRIELFPRASTYLILVV